MYLVHQQNVEIINSSLYLFSQSLTSLWVVGHRWCTWPCITCRVWDSRESVATTGGRNTSVPTQTATGIPCLDHTGKSELLLFTTNKGILCTCTTNISKILEQFCVLSFLVVCLFVFWGGGEGLNLKYLQEPEFISFVYKHTEIEYILHVIVIKKTAGLLIKYIFQKSDSYIVLMSMMI